jgi:hypothetical protein
MQVPTRQWVETYLEYVFIELSRIVQKLEVSNIADLPVSIA